MMTNRSDPGAGAFHGVKAPFEHATVIGNQFADFIMASGAQPRIEQAVDMTAHDQSFHSLFTVRDRGRSRHDPDRFHRKPLAT